MTQPASLGHLEYTANGVTTIYQYDWKIDQAEELEVRVDTTVQDEGSEYSISGIGDEDGGTITFTTAPASGAVIALRLLEPLEQLLDLTPNSILPALALEARLDRMVRMSQSQNEELSRRPALTPGTKGSLRDLTFPYPGSADSLILGWNPAKTALTLYDTEVIDQVANNLLLGISTVAGLPSAGTPGRLAPVSNEEGGLFFDQGNFWFSLNASITNVRAYGAWADGSHNDTVAVQAALDQGGTIIFPEGTYKLGLLNITAPVTIMIGRCRLVSDGSAGAMFTSSGVNCSFMGLSGRESVILPTAGQKAINLTGNWFQAGTGLTERPHFNCSRMGFDGGLHAIYADMAPGGRLQWMYQVDSCDFVNQTSYSLWIGPSVFYTYVSHCYARDVYSFCNVFDDTETKFYGNTVEVKANGGPGMRFEGSHRVVIESGDIIGGRFGNTNPDILIVPAQVDGSTGPSPSSGVVSISHMRFGPEFDQSMLIRPKVVVANAAVDLAAISLRIEDSLFYGAPPMTVTFVERTGNVAKITVAMPVVPRFDGETYTSHKATVGTEIRLSGMPTNNELNGAFIITAVTGTTISFNVVGADMASTATPGGVVINANNRAVVLTNPIDSSVIKHNTVQNFRYFVDTGSSPGASPYGTAGTSTYEGNQLIPVFSGNTLDFTSEPRDFSRVYVPGSSSHPGFDAMSGPLEAVQTQNRIQETDLTTWTAVGCTVTGPVANGMGSNSAYQIARNQAGSAISFVYNGATFKNEYTLVAAVSKLLVFTSGARQESSGVIQLRARATGTVGSSCLIVGILDKTSKLFSCFEVINLRDSTVWPAKVYRIPFRYRNGFDVANTHIVIIPGFWFPQKTTVIVDQVSVSDLPSDFVPTVGAEALDTNLGNIFRQDMAFGGFRAVPGVEGAPTATAPDGSLGAGATVTIAKNGTSLAGTLSLNTGAGAVATGVVRLAVPKSLISPAIIVSLEDGTAAWQTGAIVKISQRTTAANLITFYITWVNSTAAGVATNLTVGAGTYKINYWIIQVTDTGIA